MSSTSRTTRRSQKAHVSHIDSVATETMQEDSSGNRRSTRLSEKVVDVENKKTSADSKKHQAAPKRVFKPKVVDSSDEEDNMPAPSMSTEIKRKLMLSPGTALAEQVKTLEISSTSQNRAPRSRKAKPTNLKNKLMEQKTPEKKTLSRSVSEGTPEKRARKSDSSYSETKLASNELASTKMGALIGRKIEFESLKSWILKSKADKSPLSIYVSGQPGTGKTATTMRVLADLGKSVRSCIVNCASTNTKPALFKAIFDTLDLPGKPKIDALEDNVRNFKVPLVLVLDEVDHLANRKNEALYDAFQWPVTLSHKIIILGIANAIDLTERLLTKLMLTKQPPKRLVFEPYTKDDIVDILNDKLNNEEVAVDAKAIELTARKVAAMSGDLRTALHIFKQQKSRMMPINQEDGPPGTPINGCREVLGIINNVYSSPLARARLPLQPRILLAVSLALSSSKKSKFDRNSLMRAYYKACEACRWPSLEDDDLHSAFQTLESQSFIRQLNGGKLVLQVDAPTARSAISDNAMLDQISLLQL